MASRSSDRQNRNNKRIGVNVGKISTPKNNTYLPLLQYTGLFGINVEITETDTDWVIEYSDVDGAQACEAVEEHDGYAMQFPVEVQQLMMQNASVQLTAELNNYLDEVAQSFRYDDMKSVRSYTGFDNPYQAEALVLAQWSTTCWVKAGEIEADVIIGDRLMPTLAEVIAELPAQPSTGA